MPDRPDLLTHSSLYRGSLNIHIANGNQYFIADANGITRAQTETLSDPVGAQPAHGPVDLEKMCRGRGRADLRFKLQKWDTFCFTRSAKTGANLQLLELMEA